MDFYNPSKGSSSGDSAEIAPDIVEMMNKVVELSVECRFYTVEVI
jgi:hypothetical protein